MKITQAGLNLTLTGLLLIGALVFGFMRQPTEMGLFIAACFVALGFNNIDRIERFKAAGLEAQMRDAVEKAYATVENLKALAKPLLLSNLENLTSEGRWGGMNPARKHELRDQLEHLATELGIRDEEITDALIRFQVCHGVDLIQEIESKLQSGRSPNATVMKELGSTYSRDAKTLPSVSTIRQALKTLSAEELAEVEPLIDDYQYYLMERRPRAK